MKWMNGILAAFVVLAICAGPGVVFAQETPVAAAPAVASGDSWGYGAGLGAGLTIVGAGFGISQIAGKAVESMARQPEVAGNIQGAMIISAALIEGVTFFSLIVCILIVFFK